MSIIMNIIVILIGVTVIWVVLDMLVKKKFNESNAVLWLIIGLIAIVFGCFPHLITMLSRQVGFNYPPAYLFGFAIIVLLLIVFKSTITISTLTSKTQELAMHVSLLNEEYVRTMRFMEQQEAVNDQLRKRVEGAGGGLADAGGKRSQADRIALPGAAGRGCMQDQSANCRRLWGFYNEPDSAAEQGRLGGLCYHRIGGKGGKARERRISAVRFLV